MLKGRLRTMTLLSRTVRLSLALVALVSTASAGEKIRVAVGTQDTTINCATGGPIVRELKLLEK